ncbi:flagellar motor protein MotB [Rhodobacter calidifons]|uniref:Chemotaxis protein MotB n=1 Tax=Rhodobacter calidifons TaxID=2715277 RepID=A0ABX0G458_9RHOB|nr:flagellar motor protein MotB [Rhodobacter calidifons]NHB75919.1 chemotaxis protein MotB [Rhodobacter calidifons]
MAAQSNAAPVIIKRKKVVGGGGHHGGAWKVAYADFVTAMMAFFLLMWLLNATTEKQRKGISDYFNPTIPVNRISGGGDGAFGGNSVFAEETMAHTGTGAMDRKTATASPDRAAEDAGKGAAGEGRGLSELRDVEKALLARGGESNTMERLLRHVVTRITDEGLVIELFDLPDAPLFRAETAEPSSITLALADLLADVLNLTTNELAVSGHLRAHPVTLIDNPVWSLSALRAQETRRVLESAGIDPARMQRVSGHADRKPAVSDPTAIRNNRIEVILLRRDR